MVDYNGLENRRAERHRGFESLSLRKQNVKFMLGVFLFSFANRVHTFFQSLRLIFDFLMFIACITISK